MEFTGGFQVRVRVRVRVRVKVKVKAILRDNVYLLLSET